MKPNLSWLTLLMASSIMDGSAENGNPITPEEIDATPKQKRPPKGCKEYWFTRSGRYSNGGNDMLKTESVYYCIAASDKSAKRKFDNWLKLQS